MKKTINTKKWEGRSKCRNANSFNKRWLKIGTDIELEHTKSRRLAQRIAMDHLVEHPEYYKELVKMEHKLEKKK